MSDHEDPGETFIVEFMGEERCLTRAQLQRAPCSLLSTALLETEVSDGVKRLHIPSEARPCDANNPADALPRCAVWNGGKHLFHAVIDCYMVSPNRSGFPDDKGKRPLLTAERLLAALDYFAIPFELRPPGARMLGRIQELRPRNMDHLKRLLMRAVQMMEKDLDAWHATKKTPRTANFFEETPGGTSMRMHPDIDHNAMS
ncbi:hypothetical protein WJX73_001165 [Symbiochloris irregularis]|uniref:Uncharacterized protein n=1 Tax=Symbiochloris irregularis TaxID=706552 RepID=A0AAW1PWS9_9CHLO